MCIKHGKKLILVCVLSAHTEQQVSLSIWFGKFYFQNLVQYNVKL